MKALEKRNNGIFLSDIPNLLNLESDHVRIKVHTVGLCRTDLNVANGIIPIENNLILGHEFSGHIILSNFDHLPVGSRVSVNPYFENNKFMGLDFNGALVEFIDVHYSKVFKTDNLQLTYKHLAYLEPIAASMAPILKIKDKALKGGVYGNNRIAELTSLILKNLNYNIELLNPQNIYEVNSFDYIVETTPNEKDLQTIFELIKPNGQMILKSRKNILTGINFSYLVSKQLDLTAVNYIDFSQALAWLENNYSLINHLFGEAYNIKSWKMAFYDAAQSDSKKIFIEMD